MVNILRYIVSPSARHYLPISTARLPKAKMVKDHTISPVLYYALS